MPGYPLGKTFNVQRAGTVLYGTADPTATDGVNGEFWLNQTTYVLFGPKADGAWPAGQPLLTILHGTSDPQPTDGVDGQFWLNQTTSKLFGPKASGAWPAAQPLRGSFLLSGTVDPVAGNGTDGDFWLNTASSTLFGPKANGAWPSGVLLSGQSFATQAAASASNAATSEANAAGSASSAANNSVGIPTTRAGIGQAPNQVATQTLGSTSFQTTTTASTSFFTPTGTVTKDGWLQSITVYLAGNTTFKIFVADSLGRALSEQTVAMTGTGAVTQAVAGMFMPSGSQLFFGVVSGTGYKFTAGAGTNSFQVAVGNYGGVGTTVSPVANSTNVSLSYAVAYVPDNQAVTTTFGTLSPPVTSPSSSATYFYSPNANVDEDCYLQSFQLRVAVAGTFTMMVVDRHGIVQWTQGFTAGGTGIQTFTPSSDVLMPMGSRLWFNTGTMQYCVVGGGGTVRRILASDFNGSVGDLCSEQQATSGLVAFVYTVSHAPAGSLEKKIEASGISRSKQVRRALPSVAEERIVDAFATNALLTLTTTATLSQSGFETALSDTRTFTAAASGVRYDVLYYDAANAVFGVQAGTERAAAADAPEFIPALPSSNLLPLFNVRVDTIQALPIPVWPMLNGDDRRLSVPLFEQRHRSRACLRRTIQRIRRGQSLHIVAFGDSITAIQTADGGATVPNGSVRDAGLQTNGYLMNTGGQRLGNDLLANIPQYTSVQLGRADDGAGAIHTRFGYAWELIAALAGTSYSGGYSGGLAVGTPIAAGIGYTLGTDLTYDNFGRGGDSTANAVVSGVLQPWATNAVALHGDLVLIELGQNEYGSTSTEANMVTLIQAFQNAGSDVIVLAPPRQRGDANYNGWKYTHRALQRAARYCGAAFLPTTSIYDNQHIGAIGLHPSDTCVTNNNNHPGIMETKAWGRELIKLVLDD